MVLNTSCGEFTIRLDRRTAPKTAAPLASLARSGFYDGTVFHRIVPDFVIQAGDPTAGGSGGPGYSTRDVPLGKVVKGQAVVDAIGMLGDPAGGGTGTPLQPVVIESTKLVKA